MKTLYVLRHAKAKRSHRSGTDHARRLNARGRNAAVRVGSYMKKMNYAPDIIVSSSSARTLETSEVIKQLLDRRASIIVEYSLYLANPDRLLRTCRTLDGAYASALLIGHNPGMHKFALSLIKNQKNPFVRKLAGSFPTCALTVFRFDVDRWSSISPEAGELVDLVFPWELSDKDQ